MKNNFIEKEDSTVIFISHKGIVYECFIDKEDFDKVNSFSTTWNLNINRTGHLDGVRTRVQTNGKRKQIWIHRLLTDCPDEYIVDHLDGNIFNNLRSNLRVCNSFTNMRNSKINKNSLSGVRNIYLEKEKYSVRINNKRYGRYETLAEAIEISNKVRNKIFPECRRVLE